ncbi:SET domain-containing protein-lysine N-methyltransferase [Neolewinella litorea]|uniref:SET domain-containing protein-lysine N-methyltransferase n=1 Tax=Neolewinella litorea TaxID=2562452 RepID=A0A4S4NL80_9BACT|nr:SET domain-containing protein-lysine N-methyltransferase [Neolewinella litorea]THH39715.1 SET domain-containing protein-lysine N-methyltransferase [Neolewinella litorea]
MLHLPFLYIRQSPLGGRGVFTSEAITGGTVVELAPVVVVSPEDRKIIHGTGLHDYYFVWDGDGAAIALGYGSLYNHSTTPNLDFEMDYDFEQVRFTARRDIAPGEELLIDYVIGGGELWF